MYDGVENMLKETRKRGLSIGIITDGHLKGQKSKTAALGLEVMMDTIIITDELGEPKYRKPCDKAFQLMRDIIRNGGYRTMCYVGDNIKKDFVAPEEFGMRSIWLRNKDGLYYETTGETYESINSC